MLSLFLQLNRQGGKSVSLKKTLLSFFKKSSGPGIPCLSFITIVAEISVYAYNFEEKNFFSFFFPILFNRYNPTLFYKIYGVGMMGRFFKIE